LRVVICKFLIAFSIFSSQVFSFEVKVLLQKILNSDLEKGSTVIHSNHGFVVSGHSALCIGTQLPDKTLEFIYQGNSLLCNNKSFNSKLCHISPALSATHKQELQTYVSDWVDAHKKSLMIRCEVLHSFFDHFIEKKSLINDTSYTLLVEYVFQVIDDFLKDMMERVEDDNVVSFETLQQYARSFIQKDIKDHFLEQLAGKHLSRKDRKLLQKSQQYRYEFFTTHVHHMIQMFLQDFCLILPRNILSAWLKESVGCLRLNGNSYLGSFAILQDRDHSLLINCLDIDDYLLSVIRHEGWPGWPLEVNKVLAVACRTYLIWQVLQAQKKKRPYHIENGIRHQTYKGHHKYMRLKQAIDETKDLCISYDGKPILAMFDACCGGIVPAKIDNQDYKKYPYLVRDNTCSYCKGCKIATWKAEFLHDDMVECLQKEISTLTAIDGMKVVKTDDAGLVKKVMIEAKGIDIPISGKKMYSLFPEVKSFSFDIETLPKKKTSLKGRKKKKHKVEVEDKTIDDVKKFIIHGKGYGHHVGLCQWGAMKLVKDHHWNYQRILQFYYPGTQLIKLTYQR